VDPVADAVPRMLFSSGGRLVLADPALRTQHNRRVMQWKMTPEYDSHICPVRLFDAGHDRES